MRAIKGPKTEGDTTIPDTFGLEDAFELLSPTRDAANIKLVGILKHFAAKVDKPLACRSQLARARPCVR